MALKVHLTGGKGFLGLYTERALGGHTVISSDLPELDVTDLDALTARWQSEKPDVVCHLAGLTGAGASVADPERFFFVNTTGTLNALEACRRAEVPGFVFLSSLTVHGQTEDGRVTENSGYRPRHPYAGSKAAAEQMVRCYANSFGLRAAILRPTLIAGEGQKEANAITEFADSARKNEAIVMFGDGSHQREWLHPEDVGRAIAAGIEFAAKMPAPGCEDFLISSSAPVSMAALAQLVIDKVGSGRLEFQESTRQAFNLCTDSTRAGQILGWQPSLNIDAIVQRVLDAS